MAFLQFQQPSPKRRIRNFLKRQHINCSFLISSHYSYYRVLDKKTFTWYDSAIEIKKWPQTRYLVKNLQPLYVFPQQRIPWTTTFQSASHVFMCSKLPHVSCLLSEHYFVLSRVFCDIKRDFRLVSSKMQPKILTTTAFWLDIELRCVKFHSRCE